MKFSLSKKIEEIRQKPEHIRMRYVWGLVAFCMVLVLAVWMFSINEGVRSINSVKNNFPSMGNKAQELKDSFSSIKDIQSDLEQSIKDRKEDVSGNIDMGLTK